MAELQKMFTDSCKAFGGDLKGSNVCEWDDLKLTHSKGVFEIEKEGNYLDLKQVELFEGTKDILTARGGEHTIEINNRTKTIDIIGDEVTASIKLRQF